VKSRKENCRRNMFTIQDGASKLPKSTSRKGVYSGGHVPSAAYHTPEMLLNRRTDLVAVIESVHRAMSVPNPLTLGPRKFWGNPLSKNRPTLGGYISKTGAKFKNLRNYFLVHVILRKTPYRTKLTG